MGKRHPVISTVGIDLSYTSTGLTVYRNDMKKRNNGISMTTIRTKPKDYTDDIERKESIVGHIMDTIPENVSMICIEDFYIPRDRMQIGSAIKLIELGTLMRAAMWNADIPFFVIITQHLKMFGAGSGNASKEVLMLEVYKRWNLEPKDNNQADSAVLALLSEAVFMKLKGLSISHYTKKQQEAVGKVLTLSHSYNVG